MSVRRSPRSTSRASSTTLASLNVQCSRKFTDEAIKAAAIGCASLNSLNVSYCDRLTGEATKAVAIGCASLTFLRVARCSYLTGEAIKAVVAGCTSLTLLIKWRRNLTCEYLDTLHEHSDGTLH